MAAAYTERCYFYSAISLAIGVRGGGPQTKAGEPARGGVPAHLHAGSTAADRPEVESAAPRRGGKGLLCHGARPGAPGDSGSGCLHPLEVGRCLRGLTHGPHRKRPGRPMTIWSRRAPASPTPEHNLPVDRPAPDPRAQLAHRVTSQCVPAWIASPRLPDSPLPVSRRPPRRHRPGATRWGPALRSLRALSAPHRTPAEQCGLGPLITQLLPAPAYMPTTVTPPPTRPTRNADQPSTDLSPSGRSPTGAVDWFRAFREIEIRLMDLAARTQCSVQEHRAGAARTWRTNEHDWSVHLGLTTGVASTLPARFEDQTPSTP